MIKLFDVNEREDLSHCDTMLSDRQNHGTALLRLAENYFLENKIYTCILTSDTAADFYEKHGYQKAPGCKAKNQDPVFLKHLT